MYEGALVRFGRNAVERLFSEEEVDELDDLNEYVINFNYLSEEFSIKKLNNFPVEICYEEFIFIADDDGSIFVSVENLPSESFSQAGKLLIKLAMQLYGYTEF